MGWRERVRQFRVASAPRFTVDDARFVGSWLSAAEQRLFAQQDRYERHHAVTLARCLLATTPLPRRELVAATLLHDLGKSVTSLRRRHRVAFVCLSAVPGRPLRRLARPAPSSPWYPLWVLQHHAELGAAAARRAGVAERVAWLIEHHHASSDDPELGRLQAVDNASPQSPRLP